MKANDFDVVYRGQVGNHLAQPARRQQEWIAAGQNNFPDLRCLADVVERGGERGGAEGSPARPDHFATEAETAIDRAGIDELQENAIRIAMDYARYGAVRIIANRIFVFLRIRVELALVGNKLQCNRIVRIGCVD